MKTKTLGTIVAAMPLILSTQLANAAVGPVLTLYDWGFNIDGSVSNKLNGDSVPAAINQAGFNFATGLGTLSLQISGSGNHFFDAFFDHEIDEAINGFTNESGAANGTAAAGQSWEIDEPGWVFGDIYGNFLASGLDNTNAIPAGFEDDVSMALGWDFALGVDQTAIISLVLSDIAPTSGFYLSQTDPDSQSSIYFSSNLTISQGQPPTIPEPSVIWLLGMGLLGAAAQSRFKKQA